MICSLNQVEQIVRKAARGAGLSWGLADDVGKALRYLHAYHLNGVQALLPVLHRHAHDDYSQLAPVSLSDTWHAKSGLLDPLITGAALSDCLANDKFSQPNETPTPIPIDVASIAYPLLVAGFIGNVAEIENRVFTLSWSGVRLDCSRGNLTVVGEPHAVETETAESMRCCLADSTKPEHQPSQRVPQVGGIEIESEIWNCLDEYASRTYVESTEASRLAGAGSGLHDND